ncbi:MAG: hypothetical protein IT236_12785 [Bacteroidia bacterium]|nr:hypothetical protein [Bacteroidia bacterium]
MKIFFYSLLKSGYTQIVFVICVFAQTISGQSIIQKYLPGSFNVVRYEVKKKRFKQAQKSLDTLKCLSYIDFKNSRYYKEFLLSFPSKHDSAYTIKHGGFVKSFKYLVTSVTDVNTNQVITGYKCYSYLYNDEDPATYNRYYFIYDEDNLLKEYRRDGYSQKEAMKFWYNRSGQLRAVSGDVSLKLEYDALQRLNKITLCDDDFGRKFKRLKITYDKN